MSSTLPYDVDTMQKMLEFVRNAKVLDKGTPEHYECGTCH